MHKQPLWCRPTCRCLPGSSGSPAARPPQRARTDSPVLAGGVRGDRAVTPHQWQAACRSLVCRTASIALAANVTWDPGKPQPVAGAGVAPAVGRVGALGEMPSSPFSAAPGSGMLAWSCAAASPGGLWHNHGNCQVINRRASMSWRQNRHKQSVPGVGLHACPAGHGGPQCRMRPPGTLPVAGAVSTQQAPKRASFLPWQGCPLVTLLRGWHVAASLPCAGQGSVRARHEEAAPSSASRSYGGWMPACDTNAGLSVPSAWWLKGFHLGITEKSFGREGERENDTLTQKMLLLG